MATVNINHIRIATAARAIALRLERDPEVYLDARTPDAMSKLLRIHWYLNRFYGDYCFYERQDDPAIIVRKNRT